MLEFIPSPSPLAPSHQPGLRTMDPWIYPASYPPLPKEPYTSIFSCTFPANDRYPPSSPAFIDARTGTSLTRGDVRRLVLELAFGLSKALPSLVRDGWDGRLERGDVVLLLCPNTIAFPIALYSIIATGMTASPANTAYTPQELLHQFSNSRSKAILAHPLLVPVALQTLTLHGLSEQEARARVIVCDLYGLGGTAGGDAKLAKQLLGIEDLLGQGSLSEEVRFDGPDADATALLCYSSGTTSKPKGVMTTHANLVSVVRMTNMIGDQFAQEGEIYLGVVPFFHILGLALLVFQAAATNCRIITMERFDPAMFARSIEQYRVTATIVVPPILIALLHHPAVDKHDVSSLKMVMSAAAPLGAPLSRQFHDKMLKRGADVAVLQGYGLTETSPSVFSTPRDWYNRKYGSVGTLLPSLEARLVGENDKDAPFNGPGELWVRGPNVMKGYLNNEDATRESITEDGWFKTGDIVIRDDDGFYTIVDRKKELIKYKGFQVPPAELESVLLQHPEVADAAVIGVDSPAQATELPRAYIVPANPANLPTNNAKQAFARAVQAWVRERVANHKQIRGGCVIIDAVPKSASGKILRKELRILAAQDSAKDGEMIMARL